MFDIHMDTLDIPCILSDTPLIQRWQIVIEINAIWRKPEQIHVMVHSNVGIKENKKCPYIETEILLFYMLTLESSRYFYPLALC